MSSVPREKPDFRAQLHTVPHKPGVYLMRDRLNRVIYVGKARDLRKRVSNYFMPSRKQTADLKTRALIDSIWAFEYHTVNTEPEALLLEGRLIKEYRPRYNVSFRDDKRFLLVKVNVKEEWPRFRLTRMRQDDGARYFGPFAHAGALRQTLAFLRKKFGVLTFGRGNPTERELKSSTYQIPYKLADITSEQYKERIQTACDFMEGKSKEMLDVLDEEMRQAAIKLDFEKAADLRNMLDDLRKTTANTRKFTRNLERVVPSTVDPAGDVKALQDALMLPVPPVHMECFDISNISNTHIVASMVCFKNGVADRANYRRYRIATVKGQNDFASMAEVVRRRYSRVLLESGEQRRQLQMGNGGEVEDDVELEDDVEDSPLQRRLSGPDSAGPSSVDDAQPSSVQIDAANAPKEAVVDFSGEFSQEGPVEQVARVVADARQGRNSFAAVRLPDLVIVDGGKGQLSSACKELQRLGLHELPIIGLAKEFEEIYRPMHALPLLLPQESGALRLLQRIRDEAHRFANGYHQLLMKRRISESILDDCPGVSQTRKLQLLKHFGSVAKLKRATLEEVMAVGGIGKKLAEQIAGFLATRS